MPRNRDDSVDDSFEVVRRLCQYGIVSKEFRSLRCVESRAENESPSSAYWCC